MFVFDLEPCNVEKLGEAYAVGLHDVHRLRGKWDRDLNPD